MGKQSAAGTVSKVSSASAPAASSQLHSSNKSSLLKSSFAPSSFQLHLFASVIQSFDSQQLRLHDVSTGRLRQQHSARSGVTITSLDWGYYGTSYREIRSGSNKKKRKRIQHSAEDVVVAYGTSDSDICMYSPAEGRLVGTLPKTHEHGIKDFRFSPEDNLKAWSIGGDGELVQWDLVKDQAIRTIPLPESAIGVLASPSLHAPQVLCASSTPYCISTSDDFRIHTFDSLKGRIHSLHRSWTHESGSSELFLAANRERFLSIFDINEKKLVRTLVAGAEVERVDLSSVKTVDDGDSEQLLAVVTRDGLVELFLRPFELPSVMNGDLKSKRKALTRKATAHIKLIDSSKRNAKIYAVSIQGPELVIVSVDGGVDPAFQKVRWQDEGTGELLFDGMKEVPKAKASSTFNDANMNGAKDMGKTHLDESRATIVNGNGINGSQEAAIEISSEDDDEDEDDFEEDEDVDESSRAKKSQAGNDEETEESDADMVEPEHLAIAQTGHEPSDAEMEDAELTEPSFGDLLASKHPNTITIADSFALDQPNDGQPRQLALPSGMSLGTVLTQALRTNDKNLLETCLHADDAGIIQNTIQRLDSGLAAALLSKLAERLASRPGRYGHLMSWVQWTCIAHGGAIAAQADVTARIRSLYRVLTQRSKSLDKLLLLKGKLDMLDAQLTLRKQLQAQRETQRDNQDEPGMIYIEGQTDNWSSDEDLDETANAGQRRKGRNKALRALEDVIGREDSESGDDMPAVNGVGSENSDDDSESDEGAKVTGRTRGSLYDVEADVSGEEADSLDSDEEDGDEEDSNEEDDEEEDDSSMDDFINDGEISYDSVEDDVDLDEDPDQIRKPEKKRSKHR